MPFARPTLSELIQRVGADVVSGLQSNAASLLRYSNLRIMGKALAKVTNGLYGYLDWIALQSVPFTAQGEYAIGWGALKGITIKPAAVAIGTVTFTGADGAVIPAGTAATINGAAYVTTSSTTIALGTAAALPARPNRERLATLAPAPS